MTTTTIDTVMPAAHAGGAKGTAITKCLTDWAKSDKPVPSRASIAEEVGCTVGRVGETVRYLAAFDQEMDGIAARAFIRATEAARIARAEEKAAKPAKPRAAKAKTPTGRAAYDAAVKLIDAGKLVPMPLVDAANEYARSAKRRRISNDDAQ